jgi:hypothetical protein
MSNNKGVDDMTIYNIKERKCTNDSICVKCKHKKNNVLCNGIGKVCFAYDTLTGNVLDTITGKPLSKETLDKMIENIRKEDDK